MAETVQAPTTPTQAAPAAPAKTEAPNAPRTFKLKVDGQELELPESEVLSLAQQGKSASKRFQEAATAKREAQEIVQFLKSNPKQAFQKLGIDVRKFSEDSLMEIIQQEKMTPEQRTAAAERQELASYKEREKQAAEQAKTAKQDADTMAAAKVYDETFTKALAEKGVPKTPFTIVRMAQLTIAAQKKNLPIDASKIAQLVREDYQKEHNVLLDGLEGEDLLKFFSKDVLKKISKAQLAKYKAKGGTSATRATSPKTTESEPNPVQSWKEFTRRNRQPA